MGDSFTRPARRRLAKHPFFWLLLHDVWFRFGLVAFFSLLVFLGLFLPAIWTTSPPGFRPVVKVSGLDLAQAWSLKRTALRAAAQGQFDEATYAWKAALAKSPADTELVRGLLKDYLSNPEAHGPRSRGPVAHAFWLLKLTGTNALDLELAGQVLYANGQPELLIELIDSRNDNRKHPPSLEALYLKALFHAGRFTAFGQRWDQVAAELPSERELALYRSAFLAGWGTGDDRIQASRELQAGFGNSHHRITAARLLLCVSSKQRETDHYSKALQCLEEAGVVTLSDQIGYWRLLAWDGRKEEAKALAESESCRPASANEAIALAQLYREWGLREPMFRVFRRFAGEFSHSVEFWVAYASELVEARLWDELRQLALRMRLHPEVHDKLIAFSHFVEGRAELGQQRHFHADAAFQKVGQWEIPHPSLGLRIAGDLIRLGYAETARSVLITHEAQLASSADYWSLVFQAAEKLKDADSMLRAARTLFQLRPGDPASVGNYAAALLIHRRAPEEAVGHTFMVLARNPGSLTARINHAAALLLNNRDDEALALLRSVNPDRLPRTKRALYYLDQFEACLKLQRHEEAWAASDLIELEDLYSPQVRWLEENRRRLPPRAGIQRRS